MCSVVGVEAHECRMNNFEVWDDVVGPEVGAWRVDVIDNAQSCILRNTIRNWNEGAQGPWVGGNMYMGICKELWSACPHEYSMSRAYGLHLDGLRVAVITGQLSVSKHLCSGLTVFQGCTCVSLQKREIL